MIGKMQRVIVLLFLLVYYSKGQTTSCGRTLKSAKDSVLILSDDLVDANTAQTKCSSLGGNLAMTKDPQINSNLTQLMHQKYLRGLRRVYIFYNQVDGNRYKYSFNPTESSSWKLAYRLRHLSYLDLYTSDGGSLTDTINFCDAPDWKRKKWGVFVNKNCSIDPNGRWSGWKTRITLFSKKSPKIGQKKIYHYFGGIGSSKLRNVNESYEVFTAYKGSFQAPNINVLIGARYDTSLRGWYWSDGSQAKFPVPTGTTCLQKAFHYGIGWEQSKLKCSGKPAYYACQVKLKVSENSFQCSASTLKVSWTGLEQFISTSKLNAQVEIHVAQANWKTVAPYTNLSTTVQNLKYSTNYDIHLTAILTGCQTLNVTSSLSVSTLGNPPPTCYPPVVPSAKTFPCDASTVEVSWTGLDQFIQNRSLNAQVEIHVLELNQKIYAPYSNKSTTIQNLNHSTLYNMQITVLITGSIATNITSNLTVTTPGIPPASCIPKDPAAGQSISPGTIGGLVVGMLFLVLLIILLVLLARRRRQRPTNPRSLPTQDRNQSPPQRAEGVNGLYANVTYNAETTTNNNVNHKLFDIYKKNAESGFVFLAEEFKKIEKGSKLNQHPKEVSQFPQNAPRNRYKNIFPYDHARVVLQGTGGNDYINAAYIPGYDNERKFIASQGPKKETIDDFWWMVWQENSNIIVMLTGLEENGKTKCERYWPDVGSQTKLSPNMNVQTLQEITIGGIVQRQLLLSNPEEQRTITQLQYTTWPDHGIPVTTSNMIYLRNMVNNLHHTNAPIIVHCSAGVGRSGTYIAMDTLFHELDDKGTVDVPRTVLKMRENRIDMIQNRKQYMYLYKLLMEHESLMETDKDVTELQSMTSAEMKKMQEREYKTLSKWRFGEEWLENRPQLNTYKNTAVGVWDDKTQAVKQLDATYIQEHGCSEVFVAARNPAQGEEENFWNMIATRSASLIIDLNHGITVPLNAALRYGNVSVSVGDVNEADGYRVITILISSATNFFVDQQVTVVQVKGWDNVQHPPDELDLVNIIETMPRLKNEQKPQCVLVSCSDGSTRTGTFIALVNILERLKAQKRVDVFRIVKDLRDMRPNMVDNKELYKYCYSVVMQYLSDFSTYSNYK